MKRSLSRREFLATTAVVGALSLQTISYGATSMPVDPILELLQQSMTSKRGVTVVLHATTVALVVTEVTEAHVIGRSQQYDRIVVRLDQIQAAYM